MEKTQCMKKINPPKSQIEVGEIPWYSTKSKCFHGKGVMSRDNSI